MSKLLANGIINIRQKDFITARQTHYEKNEALIEILRRRGLHDFRKTIECLHETNQSHVAEIFESGGGRHGNSRFHDIRSRPHRVSQGLNNISPRRLCFETKSFPMKSKLPYLRYKVAPFHNPSLKITIPFLLRLYLK